MLLLQYTISTGQVITSKADQQNGTKKKSQSEKCQRCFRYSLNFKAKVSFIMLKEHRKEELKGISSKVKIDFPMKKPAF